MSATWLLACNVEPDKSETCEKEESLQISSQEIPSTSKDSINIIHKNLLCTTFLIPVVASILTVLIYPITTKFVVFKVFCCKIGVSVTIPQIKMLFK